MITRPDNLSIPFADDANPLNINTIPLTTASTQAASYEEGFPPATMLAIASGGVPPLGQDFNGIFNIITQHTRFQNAGGQYRFDADLATALGGYDAGTVLQDDLGLNAYVSTIDNNTGNFNTNSALIGTDWKPYAGEANNYAVVTLAEAQNSSSTVKRTWTPQRVWQAIAKYVTDNAVSQAVAEAGTSTTLQQWTALRVRQAIVAYVTGGYSSNFGATAGHIKFPSYFGGFIFQYAIGREDGPGTSFPGQVSQTITFDIPFTAVKCAGVSVQVSAIGTESDVIYHSTAPTNTTIQVQREVTGGQDDFDTKPIVWAVGV
jgi:hypothetical protein